MIRETIISVDTTGSAGSATGATNSPAAISGKILAVFFDFHASAPSTTDVTVTERIGSVDRQTICVETSSKTDVMRRPRVAVEDNAETVVTYDGSNEIYEPYAIHGQIRVAVAQGDALTGCVVVSIIWED